MKEIWNKIEGFEDLYELLQQIVKMNNNSTPILNEQGKKIEKRTKKD